MIRLLLLLCLGATPALAEDGNTFRFGQDLYVGGSETTIGEAGLDDVFAAGERIELKAPIAGSAHLAGRRVLGDGAVGGDLYAAGAEVTVSGPVTGDANLMGYDVTLDGALGQDLRAAGRNVHVGAPVGGTALLAGGTVALDGRIAGDAAITADTLEFGPEAAIGGRLSLYGPDAQTQVVPESVVPAQRIDRHPGLHPDRVEHAVSWIAIAGAFVVGVLILGLLATLVAVIAPRGVERLRLLVAERPFRTFWIGFLTLAVLVGATVLAVLSLIGIVVAPAILLAAGLLGFLGYLISVFLVGQLVWTRTGQLPPDTFPERAVTALIGALVVSLAMLVPFLGWLVPPVLALTGLGALSVATLRPEFRA